MAKKKEISIFEMIMIDYFERGDTMTDAEKKVIRSALINYEIVIKDELTTKEHTQEEIQNAFDAWNLTTKLIKKFSK